MMSVKDIVDSLLIAILPHLGDIMPRGGGLSGKSIFFTFLNTDRNAPKKSLECKYGHSYFKSAFGINFWLPEVVKLKMPIIPIIPIFCVAAFWLPLYNCSISSNWHISRPINPHLCWVNDLWRQRTVSRGNWQGRQLFVVVSVWITLQTTFNQAASDWCQCYYNSTVEIPYLRFKIIWICQQQKSTSSFTI